MLGSSCDGSLIWLSPEILCQILKNKDSNGHSQPLARASGPCLQGLEGTEGADVVYSPTEGATVSTSQNIPPTGSSGQDHQNNTHGGTHGSIHI